MYPSSIQSVQFSCSVLSDSLWPHVLQHTRLPCPSPRAYSNSSSWWCHPTISSLVIAFSSHLQFFPESESFPMCQFFTSGGQSIAGSASASVLPMNIQDQLTGWNSLQSKALPRVFLLQWQFKSINSLALSFLYSPTLISIHDCWKNHSFD